MKSYIHELRQSLAMNKKRIGLYTLGYLAVGYLGTLGMYLISNPGYLQPCPPDLAPYKCIGVTGLIKDLAVRPDFWFDVLTWPISLPIKFFAET